MAEPRTYYRSHPEKAPEAEKSLEKGFHVRQALRTTHDAIEKPDSNEQGT